MKRTLLACGLVFAGMTVSAQISTYVLQPPALEGALSFTWADDWGATPDLNDPANTVTGLAAFALDATVGDSLACEAVVNTDEVAGKIAVVYRGACQFGLKALNAQTAGAIAVVIINNTSGNPVGMAAGDFGGQVTIPVVMISQASGAALREEILAGNVELLIGSVLGIFENNLSVNARDVLLPKQSSTHTVLASNASEFSVELGSWIHNFGSSTQSDIVLSAAIDLNGNSLYSESSSPVTIAPGDSLFVSLPTFSQSSYTPGLYDVTYTTSSGADESFPNDNTFELNFALDSLFAYGRINPATGLPNQDAFFRPGGTPSPPNFLSCIHFQDPNASRVRAEGIHAAASVVAGASIVGRLVEAQMYEWNDPVTGLTDAAFNDVTLVASGLYIYDSDLSSQTIYIPFDEALALENNRRYLFCMFTPSDSIFFGHDGHLNYDENQLADDQPITLINNNGTWFAGGFGSDVTSAMAVKMQSVLVGVNELEKVEVTPFPNPTARELRIPINGLTGNAHLQVYDASGSRVRAMNIALSGNDQMVMDMEGLSNGTYQFHLEFADGKRSTFQVVLVK